MGVGAVDSAWSGKIMGAVGYRNRGDRMTQIDPKRPAANVHSRENLLTWEPDYLGPLDASYSRLVTGHDERSLVMRVWVKAVAFVHGERPVVPDKLRAHGCLVQRHGHATEG